MSEDRRFFIPPSQQSPMFPPPVQPKHREPSQSASIDPALSGLYPTQFFSPHGMPASTTTPSEDDDSIASPGAEMVGLKRPRPSTSASSSKKPRPDDDADSPGADNTKAKPTRGSRACTVCRRLKMKCVGAEQGPPCKRCQAGNHECIFEESNRGKRSSKKHELLTRSLRKMERTLDTVLKSISNPNLSALASGMVSRSPSPEDSSQTTGVQALLGDTPEPSPTSGPSSIPGGRAPPSPKLHSLPDNTLNPLGLLAEASLANRRATRSGPENHMLRLAQNGAQPIDAKKVGVANDVYFKPGPMTILPLRRLYIERQVQPEMLSFTSTEEVVTLFKIYFDNMNLHCPVLEPSFHTPSLVCSRSPFLLTAICAIASKFYPANEELHPRLTALSKTLAFNRPERGYKSVEIVQAYILLALWGCGPVERYEQDKTWMLLGMGIRMGTDLNLHRKTHVVHDQESEDGRARAQEVHNRERTWLICFVLDRSISAQMGKPHSIHEDFIIRNVIQWLHSPAAVPADIGICAYVELQRIVSRSLDFLYSGTSSASGLQTDCDYLLVTKTIETQILAWNTEWMGRRVEENASVLPSIDYVQMIGAFYYNYAILVVNSFGLQNALERSPVDIPHFFARCHSAATACAKLLRDKLGPAGHMRYSTDSQFVQFSYAVLSLLKYIRPEFQPYMEDEQKTIALVKDVADLMDSIAANPLHTPALYSTLLHALISARTEPGTTLSNNGNGTGTSPWTDQNGVDVGVRSASVGDTSSALGLSTSGLEGTLSPLDFQLNGEVGPRIADMTKFPPTLAMANAGSEVLGDSAGMLSMDSILSTDFWDNVLMPGYSNAMEGISGGFVYGAGGSGFITSRVGSPTGTTQNSPRFNVHSELTEPSTTFQDVPSITSTALT